VSAADGASVAENLPAPIADDELESLFSVFPDQGCVVLAISGGADSTALLWLASRWRTGRGRRPDLIAATIDHGLRPQSGAEAQGVGALARQLGIRHEILTWEGVKPATGLEAAARAARYALLGTCAERFGARAVATAHTLDDQAETFLMRLAAGSGPSGLVGMRRREKREGFMLLRPFLGVRKHRLVATLQRDAVGWSEDAMNSDPRFARPRLRAAAEALAREGLTPERLGRLAERMGRYEEAVAAGAEAARRNFRDPDDSQRLDGWALIATPEELVLRALLAEIREAGGDARSPHTPRLERLEALWEWMRLAILAGKPARRTLGGAAVSIAADGSVRVVRAAPRRTSQPAESVPEALPPPTIHQD
jgi:tRNA(Ile)-lysidine synthase